MKIESPETNTTTSPLNLPPDMTFNGHTHNVNSATFSPDGKCIVTGSSDKTARIWDVESGSELLRVEGTSYVHSATFSPDGKRIVTGCSDSAARIWDVESGSELLKLEGHTSDVNTATFSPDGKCIATGSSDKTARIWDAQSGKELQKLTGHKNWVLYAAFSPDGRKIVTAGSRDDTARIWDAQSGIELRKLEEHTNAVRHAVFSPDGKKVVTASYDKTARIWDAESGTELHILTGHRDWVLSAAFFPDGTTLVTSSLNGTVRTWDAESGKKIKSFRGHTYTLKSAAFSPDGRKIVTAEGKTVRVWNAQSEKKLSKIAYVWENIEKNFPVDSIIRGTVISLVQSGVVIEIEEGITGRLHVTDMHWTRTITNPSEVIQQNQQITCKILFVDKEKRRIVFGLKQLSENPWTTWIPQKYHVGQIVIGTVISFATYGVFIEIEGGITGLLHVADMHWTRKIKNPSEVVQQNQQITCKVLSVDKENCRIALGLKQLSEEPWTTWIPEKYQAGQIVVGTVVNIVKYGAFIEIEEGITGLLHVTNMHWIREIKHPSEFVQKNQQITCKILLVDKEKHLIAFGLKQLSEDPWATWLPTKYQVGKVVIGTVVTLIQYGVFVEFEDDVTGLLHVSELAKHQAENPGETVEVGKKIKVKVLHVDIDNRRIRLGSTQTELTPALPHHRVNPLTWIGTRIMNKIHEIFG